MKPGIIYQSRECSTLLLWKNSKGKVLAYSKINGAINEVNNDEPDMTRLTETPFEASDIGLTTLEEV